MNILNRIIELSDIYEDRIIDIRRKIHKNPELAFNEFDTAKLIEKELKDIGLEPEINIGGTGVMAVLKGKNTDKDSKVLLLRADMDALPIEELNDIEYRSKNPGIMHACGHDVHIANLLGVARILYDIRNEIDGVIKFIFQPAEERGGGARQVIEAGILKNPDVDNAMAFHIVTDSQASITIGKENITANSDGFILKIYGKKAHSSSPEQGVDAINIAGHIIVGLNSIMSSRINPYDIATFNIGKINGGTAANIIPDYIEMEGLLRTITDNTRKKILNDIENIARDIANSYGGDIEFELIKGYPSIYNDIELADMLIKSFEKKYHILTKGLIDIKPGEYRINRPIASLSAEDFGFYSKEIPSIYYQIGMGDFGNLHSGNFNIDEDYIKFCVRTMSFAVIEYFNQ